MINNNKQNRMRFTQLYSNIVNVTLGLTLLMYCYKENVKRNRKIKKMIKETTKKCLITLDNKHIENPFTLNSILFDDIKSNSDFTPIIEKSLKSNCCKIINVSKNDLNKLNFIKYSSNEKYDFTMN